MLNRARNFLMVPPGLNQVCLFFCWTTMFSLVRCFHSRAMKTVRILENRSEGLVFVQPVGSLWIKYSEIFSISEPNGLTLHFEQCNRRQSHHKNDNTLTFVVVSQNRNDLYWTTERLQLKVLWGETSLNQVSHWCIVYPVCNNLVVLTRSVKILRNRKVKANNDWLWWFNPPGFGHLHLWRPNSVDLLKKSMTAKMLLELCVFSLQLTPRTLALMFKSISTSSIDPYSLVGKKEHKNQSPLPLKHVFFLLFLVIYLQFDTRWLFSLSSAEEGLSQLIENVR